MKYILLTDEISVDSATRKGYGIALIEGNSRGFSICGFVSDISTDKAEVLELIARFNRLKLSPVHFFEAVEDFLNTVT